MNPIAIAIGTRLGQWLLEKGFSLLSKGLRWVLANYREDKKIDSTVARVKQAAKDQYESETVGLIDGRLPKNHEDKLRAASRTLRRNMFS